jgi:hypothetical protein
MARSQSTLLVLRAQATLRLIISHWSIPASAL